MGRSQSWKFEEGSFLSYEEIERLKNEFGVVVTRLRPEYCESLDNSGGVLLADSSNEVIESRIDATNIGWKADFTDAFAERLIEICPYCGQAVTDEV